MIPPEVQLSMLKKGALIDDGEKAIINFKVVEEEFPSYLEYLVLYNLNDFETNMYLSGYMHYVVRQDGLLEWKQTVTGRTLAAQLDLPKQP